eukprot:COSAG01_NODE_41192_length_454_cov_1.833803_1_plen_118_part_00
MCVCVCVPLSTSIPVERLGVVALPASIEYLQLERHRQLQLTLVRVPVVALNRVRAICSRAEPGQFQPLFLSSGRARSARPPGRPSRIPLGGLVQPTHPGRPSRIPLAAGCWLRVEEL